MDIALFISAMFAAGGKRTADDAASLEAALFECSPALLQRCLGVVSLPGNARLYLDIEAAIHSAIVAKRAAAGPTVIARMHTPFNGRLCQRHRGAIIGTEAEWPALLLFSEWWRRSASAWPAGGNDPEAPDHLVEAAVDSWAIAAFAAAWSSSSPSDQAYQSVTSGDLAASSTAYHPCVAPWAQTQLMRLSKHLGETSLDWASDAGASWTATLMAIGVVRSVLGDRLAALLSQRHSPPDQRERDDIFKNAAPECVAKLTLLFRDSSRIWMPASTFVSWVFPYCLREAIRRLEAAEGSDGGSSSSSSGGYSESAIAAAEVQFDLWRAVWRRERRGARGAGGSGRGGWASPARPMITPPTTYLLHVCLAFASEVGAMTSSLSSSSTALRNWTAQDSLHEIADFATEVFRAHIRSSAPRRAPLAVPMDVNLSTPLGERNEEEDGSSEEGGAATRQPHLETFLTYVEILAHCGDAEMVVATVARDLWESLHIGRRHGLLQKAMLSIARSNPSVVSRDRVAQLLRVCDLLSSSLSDNTSDIGASESDGGEDGVSTASLTPHGWALPLARRRYEAELRRMALRHVAAEWVSRAIQSWASRDGSALSLPSPPPAPLTHVLSADDFRTAGFTPDYVLRALVGLGGAVLARGSLAAASEREQSFALVSDITEAIMQVCQLGVVERAQRLHLPPRIDNSDVGGNVVVPGGMRPEGSRDGGIHHHDDGRRRDSRWMFLSASAFHLCIMHFARLRSAEGMAVLWNALFGEGGHLPIEESNESRSAEVLVVVSDIVRRCRRSAPTDAAATIPPRRRPRQNERQHEGEPVVAAAMVSLAAPQYLSLALADAIASALIENAQEGDDSGRPSTLRPSSTAGREKATGAGIGPPLQSLSIVASDPTSSWRRLAVSLTMTLVAEKLVTVDQCLSDGLSSDGTQDRLATTHPKLAHIVHVGCRILANTAAPLRVSTDDMDGSWLATLGPHNPRTPPTAPIRGAETRVIERGRLTALLCMESHWQEAATKRRQRYHHGSSAAPISDSTEPSLPSPRQIPTQKRMLRSASMERATSVEMASMPPPFGSRGLLAHVAASERLFGSPPCIDRPSNLGV
mgnify:CR=1 FL=1